MGAIVSFSKGELEITLGGQTCTPIFCSCCSPIWWLLRLPSQPLFSLYLEALIHIPHLWNFSDKSNQWLLLCLCLFCTLCFHCFAYKTRAFLLSLLPSQLLKGVFKMLFCSVVESLLFTPCERKQPLQAVGVFCLCVFHLAPVDISYEINSPGFPHNSLHGVV